MHRKTATLGLAGLIAALTVGGCNVSHPARSLKDEASSFRVVPTAPDSSFRAAALPDETFRLAGVDSALRPRTMELLGELKARQTGDDTIIVPLPADILFDFDKADLRPDATPALERAAELLKSFPASPLAVTGHTDAMGDDAYNDPLSLRRAQAVADWIKTNSGRSAAVEGKGERDPVAANTKPDGSDDPDGRQKNRRVEIVIKPTAVATDKATPPPDPGGPTAASDSSFGAKPK